MAGGAVARITGAFTATGQSSAVKVFGPFNVELRGTFTATVAVERSFDGTNFVAVATDGTGTAASYTAPMSVAGEETESEVTYRFNCTSYSSGTATYRLSQIVLDYNDPRRARRLS